jgi:elongation factor P
MPTTTLAPGMVISLSNKLYRVESAVKVTPPKGTAFVRAKLCDLTNGQMLERNFKPNQLVEDITLREHRLEYLYLEEGSYLFLDIDTLDKVVVPSAVVGDKASYLKEGVEVVGSFYGDECFAVGLPQFLELMVSKAEERKGGQAVTDRLKSAILETGAVIEVPPFVEAGDIVKVDTSTGEFVQRV